MDGIVNFVNGLVSKDWAKIFIFVITGVFMGYTLYPVPKVMDELFMHSTVFKFIALFLATAVAIGPLNRSSLITSLLMVGAVLLVFQLIRRYDNRVMTMVAKPIVNIENKVVDAVSTVIEKVPIVSTIAEKVSDAVVVKEEVAPQIKEESTNGEIVGFSTAVVDENVHQDSYLLL